MKARYFARIGAFFVGLMWSGMLAAAEPVPVIPGESQEQSAQEKAQPQIYTHPVAGFSIAVPPGVQLLERDEKNPQITIRSRKGYMISIQTGDARPEVALEKMPARLEAKYLGDGKPWSHKKAQKKRTIAGLPAIEGIYEGANTKARVDIIRGLRTDHVFIFFAASREYENLEHEFEWMLSHFLPGPDDIEKPVVTMSSDSSVFAEAGYGYSIRYPSEWIYSKPSHMTAMFSGTEGSPAFSALISVQNIAPTGAKDAEQAAQLALANLKASLARSVQKLQFLEDKPWAYVRGPHHLIGREITMSYTHAGQEFMKRVIVVPRPFQKLAHIWSYTAPVDIFKTYTDTANRMLHSWTILASNNG